MKRTERWKYKKRIKRQSATIKRLRRLSDYYKGKAEWAKQRLHSLEDGYVTEWCLNCMSQITMLWDVETQGRVATCPVCGSRLMLCENCQGECDYERDIDLCKEM